MREGTGLYRGKRLDNGEWVEGNLLTAKDGAPDRDFAEILVKDKHGYAVMWYEVDMETIGQWTGLLDKNGVKVFEGDLVKGQQGIMRVFYGKITGYGYGFQWENIGDGFEESMTGFIDEYEVIGSIHDKAVEDNVLNKEDKEGEWNSLSWNPDWL